jgi:hypothetical protein
LIKRIQLIFGLAIVLIASPCKSNAQQSSKGMLSIAFNHYADSVLLNLDSTIYKNNLGQTFTVTNFKYYIGTIHLQKADGKEYISPDYFLINEEDEKSKKIILSTIPNGEYTSVSFIVGVDSIHNCSGAQAGALDPANAMFWAWNSGYIFLKLEGKSSSSTVPGKIFEYHIGGYKSPANCIRTIQLKFDPPLVIENNKTAALNLKVNLAEILKTPTNIDFTKLPSVTDSRNASIIADNYKDMFTIQK